jgi:hypothetical protein
MNFTLNVLTTLGLIGLSSTAQAQPQTSSAPVADQINHKKVADGPRFRFGVSSGAGPITGDYHFFYAGTELRFGAQLNDLLGVYVQQQLGYYEIRNSAGSMGTGPLLGVSAGADFTFLDRLFAGAGVGYAVFNSQAGPELHFRLGGYPLMKRNATKPRRHGLMLGTDFRIHFIQGGYTFFAPTFSLGYEAF